MSDPASDNHEMDFRDWLKQEMAARDMSQAELSRRSRVPQPTIQRILSSETGDPRGSTIAKLKNVLGGYVNAEPGPAIKGMVPLISSVQAGHWAEIMDRFQPGDADEWIETTANVSKQSFAMRITGDSMEPTIPNKAIVIVDPHKQPTNGSVVVARRNGDQTATIKRLVIDGGTYYLKPDNNRYPIIELTVDSVICGVAVRIEIDL